MLYKHSVYIYLDLATVLIDRETEIWGQFLPLLLLCVPGRLWPILFPMAFFCGCALPEQCYLCNATKTGCSHFERFCDPHYLNPLFRQDPLKYIPGIYLMCEYYSVGLSSEMVVNRDRSWQREIKISYIGLNQMLQNNTSVVIICGWHFPIGVVGEDRLDERDRLLSNTAQLVSDL